MMYPLKIIAEMEALNVRISIHRYNETYMLPKVWAVSFTATIEGTKLEVSKEGTSFADTLRDAYDQFHRHGKGIPFGLLAAPVEGKLERPEDLPF